MVFDRVVRKGARVKQIRKLQSWSRQKLADRPILQNVLVLFTGTAAAQAFAMAAALITARLFTPEAFGQFAIYGAITGVIITIANLRYDMTIVLPETDDEARVIARLAMRANIVISLLTVIAALALRGVVIDIWGSEELAFWLPVGGLTVFLSAAVAIMQYWFNRKVDYKTISINRFQQTAGSSGGEVLLGAFGLRSMAGLLWGVLLGQIWAFGNLWRKSKSLRQPVASNTPSMREMAKRYKKMPLLNLPNALIDAVRLNGIVLLIGTIALGAVGQFNLAWQSMQVPIGLINGAISQVFFERLARVERGSMRPLVRATIKRAFLLGLPPFIIIYIIAPWIFTFVFGSQWNMVGDIARALTPWLALMLVTSPVSTVFVVTFKQHWMLIFSIFFMIFPLGWLYFSPLSLIPTLTVLGWLMAGMLIINLFLVDLAATYYDREAVEKESSAEMLAQEKTAAEKIAENIVEAIEKEEED